MSKSCNPTKNNNGWVLCPSKTFPGKFYYFNVVNGETAWSMNDAEKIVTKKDSEFHKITDNSHCYPEPDTPPIESSEITTTNIYQQFKPPNLANSTKCSYVQRVPTFGQAAFPKYVPNIESCMPSIIWMPIQCSTPVCIPEIKRSKMDQVTQTSDPSILVQSRDPCCKRFVNYEKPTINFDKQNKILNKDSYSHCETSMLLKNKVLVPNLNIKEPVLDTSMPNIKEFQFQTRVPSSKIQERPFETSTPNKKEFKIQTGVPNLKIRKAVFNLESDSKIRVDNGNSTLGPCDSVENVNPQYVKFLPVSDLRHRLTSARKRNMGDQIDGLKDLKNNVTQYGTQKRVSFDLTNFLDEDTCSTTKNEDTPTTGAANQTNTQVCGNTAVNIRAVWYIVVDTEVWLDEHEFIESVVLSDKNCRLLIPHAVRIDIEALSQGECRGRQRVFVARQLARRCAAPPQHYVVEPSLSAAAGNIFTTDSILECCIDVINDNYRVIVISNDPQLHIKAKSNNIPCYRIQDIKKTDVQTQAEIDLKKIKITVTRDCDDMSSDGSDNTLEVSVDSFRTHLFRENTVEENRNNSKCDQNPILNYDSDSTINEIKDLKNLHLNDRNLILNIKRTVINSNYIPNSNESKVQKEKEGIVKAARNSNIEDEFLLQEPIPELNFDNSMFLFQNAAKKYASAHSFEFKTPSTSTETFLNPNKILIEKNKIPKIPEHQNKTPIENTRKPIITEPSTRISQKNQPTFPLSYENNLNSKFKFNQTNMKVPPSFHLQKQNELKNNFDNVPVLDEQLKNIDLDLKRFCVKNKIVDLKMQRRMEECICSYIQIMEDTLTDILQQSDHVARKKLTPPWTLQDAILNIQIIYENNPVMKSLVQKYLDFLTNATCKNGKLNPNMKSNDFMKILGCGLLLVQQFRNIYPDNKLLVDAEKNLNRLLETIECPIEVNTEEFDSLKTPVVCRSELDEQEMSRRNFVKDTSYVLDYLKKHYKGWDSYVMKEKPPETTPPELKVVRIFGKNLNMLKIDNNKSISLLKDIDPDKDGPKTIRSLNNQQPVERSAAKYMSMATKDTRTNMNDDKTKMIKLSPKHRPVTRSLSLKNSLSLVKSKDNGIENNIADTKTVKLSRNDRPTASPEPNTVKLCETPNAGLKLVKTIANDNFMEADCEKQIHESLQKAESKVMSLDSPIHGNTFLQSRNDNAGPKMIRNLQTLEKYNNKLKDPLDLDLLDYSGINESFNDKSFSNLDIISISCDSYSATDIIFENQTNHNCINDNNKPNNYDFKNEHNTCPIKNANTSINNEKTNRSHVVSANDNFDACDDYRINYVSRNDSCTNDSGFENDSTCAHSVVKIFFTELSDSFKIIHKFINDCVKEINSNLSEERKKMLHEKAAKSLELVGVMTQEMNGIVTRELNETTALRTLLLQAGIEASSDKRISRYRQFVMKCVEQAGILENALKIIVSLTADAGCESIDTASVSSGVRYFNIFDIAS